MNKKEPKNYIYWKSIVEDPDKAAEFMIRGSERQKKEIKRVFKYIENQKTLDQPDLFN